MLWPLLFILLVLALGGFYGGIAMLADPTGSSLEADVVLHLIPIPDYILPGLFLLIVMGVLPLLLVYALFARPKWPWIERLFNWSNHYWAWTGTLTLVGILAVWLVVEGLLIGFWPITYITAFLGLLIFLFSVFPGVRNYFANSL
jgi:hypothetical protein